MYRRTALIQSNHRRCVKLEYWKKINDGKIVAVFRKSTAVWDRWDIPQSKWVHDRELLGKISGLFGDTQYRKATKTEVEDFIKSR